MTEIRVTYKNFWKTFIPEGFTEFLFKPVSNVYNVIYDPNEYNLEICSTFDTNELDKDVPSVFWSMEGIWDIDKFDISEYDWAFYFFPEEMVNDSKYCRINMVPPSMVGPRNIDIQDVKNTHTKFCNFVYRNPIPFRNEFFELLSQYKHIDSPGLCKNNINPIGDYEKPMDSRTSTNWANEKYEFLKSYKFTIAFESHEIPGYTTEKIVQPLNANSIPIYWGNPYISKDFNSKAFINYYDYDSIDEFIDQIKKVDNDDSLYEQMLCEPKAMKHNQNRAIDHWLRIFEAVK